MLFVDESIQKDLGYICVGFAYCEDYPDIRIQDAILNAGFNPEVDEYKSGYRMEGSIARKTLRDSISEIVLEKCKLGVYIADISERSMLRSSVAKIASQLVEINKLDSPQLVFIDEGIDGKTQPSDEILLKVNCDSRKILGIQLADFIAYHCSYLLKCSILGNSKKIYISDDSPHPLIGEEIELDWLIRTDFRRHFFVEPRNIDEITGDDWFFKLSGYGAFYSTRLSETVKVAAEQTFDSMYFGCVW